MRKALVAGLASLMLVVPATAHASRISFKVGTAPVERTLPDRANGPTVIRLYVNGHEIAGEGHGCNVFFHQAWLTVRAHSCDSDTSIKLRAVNAGKAKRVTFVWRKVSVNHRKGV